MKHFCWIVIAAVGAGCGGPAAPTSLPPAPPLADGRFSIDLGGGYFECPNTVPPGGGGIVYSMLTATHDSNGTWIAKSSSAFDGTLEIRLTRTSTPAPNPATGLALSPFFGTYVTGTISGKAVYSVFPGGGPSALLGRDSFLAPADTPTSGAVIGERLASGYVNGAATFDIGGSIATCGPGKSSWLLNGPF